MKLKRWSGPSYCKTKAEIDSAIKNLKLELGITDYYFDSGDFSNPVKINISTNNVFTLIPSFTKSVKVMIRKNDVTDATSPLPFASSSSYSFFSVGQTIQDYYAEGSDGAVLDLTFALEDKYQTIDRTVFTFGDMFGKVGGMDSMLCMIASFLVGVFSSKLYKFSLVSSFYDIVSTEPYNKVES